VTAKVILFLILVTTLETLGDDIVRMGIGQAALLQRVGMFLIGGLLLFGYGFLAQPYTNRLQPRRWPRYRDALHRVADRHLCRVPHDPSHPRVPWWHADLCWRTNRHVREVIAGRRV